MGILRILLGVAVVFTFFVSRSRAEDFTDLYESHVFNSPGGETLPYRLMKPANYNPDAATKYPLVLFLHGSGERGTDNSKTLVHAAREFAKADVREKHPCFVVVPQCREDRRWVEVDWALETHEQLPEDSPQMKLVLELLTSLEKEYRVDDKRLYATGLSMGGFGTWDLVTRYPDKFAAAAIVCGGGDEKVAAKVAKMPIWVFHGDKDDVVKPGRSRNMIAAIEKAGGKPIYTEYPDVGHGSWDPAYADPKLMDWLFAQKRP